MFHDGDLQSGISVAVQQSKAVLCFIDDGSESSSQWRDILVEDEEIRQPLAENAISLHLRAGTQEAGFLSSLCPLNSLPAVIIIRNGTIELNLQADQADQDELRRCIVATFTRESPGPVEQGPPAGDPTGSGQPPANRTPSPSASTPAGPSRTDDEEGLQTWDTNTQPFGRVRQPLDNGLNDDRNDTEEAINRSVQHQDIAANPPSTLDTNSVGREIPRHNVTTEGNRGTSPRLIQPAVLANVSPPSVQTQQRDDYVKMQKEREQKQREERDRIKQQIKADREERRRLDQIRKQPNVDVDSETSDASRLATQAKSVTAIIRLQVRTFDGSTLRQNFPPSATIAGDVRPWIDSSIDMASSSKPGQGSGGPPYDLKLILTPLPNRTIEAGEEGLALSDLGVKGSCTFVMVPVKGYVVDSYSSGSSGLVGSAVTTGYNLITGTAGAVFGGLRTFLGYGAATPPPSQNQPTGSGGPDSTGAAASTTGGVKPKNVKVRTLADQRVDAAAAARPDQQFYNGNQLNFQPRKTDRSPDRLGSDNE